MHRRTLLSSLALAGTGNGELHDFKGNELVLSVAGTGDIVASGLEMNCQPGAWSNSRRRMRPTCAACSNPSSVSGVSLLPEKRFWTLACVWP